MFFHVFYTVFVRLVLPLANILVHRTSSEIRYGAEGEGGRGGNSCTASNSMNTFEQYVYKEKCSRKGAYTVYSYRRLTGCHVK